MDKSVKEVVNKMTMREILFKNLWKKIKMNISSTNKKRVFHFRLDRLNIIHFKNFYFLLKILCYESHV